MMDRSLLPYYDGAGNRNTFTVEEPSGITVKAIDDTADCIM